jgi:hypothetical protein
MHLDLSPRFCISYLAAPAALLAVSLLPSHLAAGEVEAFEVGAHNTAELPRGKEADGIFGDFVLRNAHVEAVIAGNLPGRKANMTTNSKAPTPGCLYDLCVRGAHNDQITYLGPGGLDGAVSSVRLGPSPLSDQDPAVHVERSAASAAGREEAHVWCLREGWRYLLVRSVYRNCSEKPWKLKPGPVWKGFSEQKTVLGIRTGDATNPRDRHAYSVEFVEHRQDLQGPAGAEEVELKPGEERTFATFIAPGRSPAEAFGVLAARRGATGTLVAKLSEGTQPVCSATLLVHFDDKTALKAYPDAAGTVALSLPPGKYDLSAEDLGRPSVRQSVEVLAGNEAKTAFELAPAASIAFRVTSDSPPSPSPCKVQFLGLESTKDPDLGVEVSAHGCRHQYLSENGRFSQQVPPGKYRLVVTRGIEFTHEVREVDLQPGQTVHISAHLERVVDTRGWVSTDYHNHSTPSGDNYCGTDDRVISLAAEHIEFAPTTEHNRFYDWGPHIERLGLANAIVTNVGIELTGPNAHFNAFPFKVESFVQDGGAPQWQHDPRINAIVLRDHQGGSPERWVQINHPQVGKFFRDRDADGVADGGYAGLEDLIDAAEVWSTEVLNQSPKYEVEYEEEGKKKKREIENRTFAWLQLLNQGRRMWCVAVSDAHNVYSNSVGGWRTYVKSSQDTPRRFDPKEIIRSSKAGRMFVTNGPYLEVALDDGTLPGGSTVVEGPFHVHVRVQATSWIDIDRVQVLVNGRPEPKLNFTRGTTPDLFGSGVLKFDHRVPVTLAADAHLIVVAAGEAFHLSTGYARTWEGKMHPVAFTNPIYVDADGNGFQHSGDNLGHPLPVGK